MDRQAGHTAVPMLGSNRIPKTFKSFLEDMPIQDVNPAFYNSWSIKPWLDSIPVPGANADTSMNGLAWGAGGDIVEPADPILNADGSLSLVTAAGNDDEILAAGPIIGSPAAGRPITFLIEGELADVSATAMFVGLAAVSTPFDSAGPMVSATGALGTVDMVGMHHLGSAATVPNLAIRDGVAAADLVALTGLPLADNVGFRFAVQVRSTSVKYYLAIEGTSEVILEHTTPATTLTNLVTLRPVYNLQNIGAGANTLKIYRSFVGQELRYTDSFMRWLRSS